MVEISMQVGQKFPLTASAVPPAAKFDGTPSFAVEPSGIVTVSPNGLTAQVTAVAPGTATLTIKATSQGKTVWADHLVKVIVLPGLHVEVGPPA